MGREHTRIDVNELVHLMFQLAYTNSMHDVKSQRMMAL